MWSDKSYGSLGTYQCQSTDLWSWDFLIHNMAIIQLKKKFSIKVVISQRHPRSPKCLARVSVFGVLLLCKITMGARTNRFQLWSVAQDQASWWRIFWGRSANSQQHWKVSAFLWLKVQITWPNSSRRDSWIWFKRSLMFSWVMTWRQKRKEETDFSIRIKGFLLAGTLMCKVFTITWCRGSWVSWRRFSRVRLERNQKRLKGKVKMWSHEMRLQLKNHLQ